MIIELGHYNDGKNKLQSHEIIMLEDYLYHADVNMFGCNPFDITGYGQTKEEALADFKKKFEYAMNELNAFSKMLFEEDVITVDVDCTGRKIEQ